MRTSVPRRAAVAITALVVAAALGSATVLAPPATATGPCTDGGPAAIPFTVDVAGERADGLVARPAADPEGIVVVSHGFGHSSASWKHHLERISERLGVIAVAMDYRGLRVVGTKANGLPDTRGWNVKKGAEDGVAAAAHFERLCPTATTIVNYGVSLGGNTSGLMAATPAMRADGTTPLFDWWVAVEPVVSLVQTYTSARVAAGANDTARKAQEDIEEETGGPIESVPEAYAERTVLTRTADIAAAGLKGVTFVHGVEDGTVGFEQSNEMRVLLEAERIPTQLFAVTLKPEGYGKDGNYSNYAGQDSGLAGHGSEVDETHPVMALSFERLDAIFAGDPPDCTATIVAVDTTRVLAPDCT